MVQQGHRFWNVIIVLTVFICLMAFLAHSKNWTKIDQGQVKILSGFYFKKVKFSQMDSIVWVDKIPPMERLNGFSAFEKEKGIFREFKDSLTDIKVNVYVDNLLNQKIKVVYDDSLKLYINYKDSVNTVKLFNLLQGKVEAPNGKE